MAGRAWKQAAQRHHGKENAADGADVPSVAGAFNAIIFALGEDSPDRSAAEKEIALALLLRVEAPHGS